MTRIIRACVGEYEPNMGGKVNLDAVILRTNMKLESTAEAAPLGETDNLVAALLKREQLAFLNLRKPDFQRETSCWSVDKVAELVRTFVDGELIPAVILWKTGSYNFTIDGAHRLSALIAWVNNDYGDGPLSRNFFGFEIPEDQKGLRIVRAN